MNELDKRIYDYSYRVLPNEYLKEMERKHYDKESSREFTGATMGYPAWNLLYYTFLCSISTNVNVIETGTNYGFSTIVLAQVLKDLKIKSKVKTVELNEDNYKKAIVNVNKAGLTDYVEFNLGNSIDFLEGLKEEVTFAFLDSCHDCDHVYGEFRILKHKLAKRAKVFFDNTSRGGVKEALNKIKLIFGGDMISFNNCSWSPPGCVIWENS